MIARHRSIQPLALTPAERLRLIGARRPAEAGAARRGIADGQPHQPLQGGARRGPSADRPVVQPRQPDLHRDRRRRRVRLAAPRHGALRQRPAGHLRPAPGDDGERHPPDGAGAERRPHHHQAHPRRRRAVADDPQHRRRRAGRAGWSRRRATRPAASAASRRRPAPPGSAASRTITPAARPRSSWRCRSSRAARSTTWTRSPPSRAWTASSSDPATSPPASAISASRATRRWCATIEEAVARIGKAGKHAGILTPSEELAHRYIAAGTRFTAVGSDMGLLARNAEALAARFRA